MKDKALVHCESKVLRGHVIRSLVENDFDVSEAWDEEDARMKLELFGSSILLYVIEVQTHSRIRLYEWIHRLKQDMRYKAVPVLAILPKDTSDMVGGALKAGVDDVLLLPESRDQMRMAVSAKLRQLGEKYLPKPEPIVAQPPADELPDDDVDCRDELIRELKLANRGGHTVSLLLIRTQGLFKRQLKLLEEELSKNLRDTDRVLQLDANTFVVVCPFTAKNFLVEVERKVHAAYSSLFGGYTPERRIYMYGANYPTDERDLEKLINRMESGVHDSMAVNKLKEPLRQMSREEIENFRKKLKLYRY